MTNDIQRAAQLLEAASERLAEISDETSAFNLLSVLQLERYETQTHSKIIFFLLNSRQNGENRFLRLFLEMLKIPEGFREGHWSAYREKSFDDGASRIDFVLESASYCAIVEMKVGAVDGSSQLARYDAFGRRKRKKYGIYYLTLDGHNPEEQSVKGVDLCRLWCVSFEKGIVSWLQRCMETVPPDGWQYSFLKQYLGAVRQVTGTGDGELHVMDLISSSDMARAAQLVMNSFQEKMEEVKVQFFRKLYGEMQKHTGLDSCFYQKGKEIGFDLALGAVDAADMYFVTICVYFDDTNLYASVGFSEKTGDGEYIYMPLADAKERFPQAYQKWMGKLDCLPGLRRTQYSRWDYLQDPEGHRLNFRTNEAQIRLLDEMDTLCEWVAEDLDRRWILPLTQG